MRETVRDVTENPGFIDSVHCFRPPREQSSVRFEALVKREIMALVNLLGQHSESRQHQASCGSSRFSSPSRRVRVGFRPTSKFGLLLAIRPSRCRFARFLSRNRYWYGLICCRIGGNCNLQERSLPLRGSQVTLACLHRVANSSERSSVLPFIFDCYEQHWGDPHGSVSCAPTSSELRHYGVFDGTHCNADVCCGGFMARCRWFEEDLGLDFVLWFIAHVQAESSTMLGSTVDTCSCVSSTLILAFRHS